MCVNCNEVLPECSLFEQMKCPNANGFIDSEGKIVKLHVFDIGSSLKKRLKSHYVYADNHVMEKATEKDFQEPFKNVTWL